MDSMRLLVVSQYFWPEHFRVNDLVSDLVSRGHQVTVLTGRPNYPDGKVFKQYQDSPEKFSNFNGAQIVRVPMAPRGQGSSLRLMLNYVSFAASASIFGLWKLRGREFDAIFVFEPSPVTVGLPAVLLRAIKRAPLAFWVLDLWPETLQAIGAVRSPRLLRAIGQLVSFIYRRCDLILAQSNSFIPQIRKYAGQQSNVEYFPAWSEAEFDLENVSPADEVPQVPGSFSLLFAGNIGTAQDFPAILAAAECLKEHKQIRWLIVGDGRVAKWLQQEITRRNLQDYVFLFGRHPIGRMPSFYKHADALLVSLKAEPIFALTIPGKLQSYLASGIPILAMLDGEGATVVKNSNSGLTCPAGDPAGLASAVLALSRMSKEDLDTMGRNGKHLSATEFDRRMLIDRLERWLLGLSKQPSQRA